MASNVFFFDGGRNLYGEVFGNAIQYEIEKETSTERPIVRVKANLIQPESIYHSWQSKYELVCECIKKLVMEIGDFDFIIYGRSLPILKNDTQATIAEKIRNLQKSFIKIDENLDNTIKREIKSRINDFLKTLDIF